MPTLRETCEETLRLDAEAPREHRWVAESDMKPDGTRRYFPHVRTRPTTPDAGEYDRMTSYIVINNSVDRRSNRYEQLAEYIALAVNDAPRMARALLAILSAIERLKAAWVRDIALPDDASEAETAASVDRVYDAACAVLTAADAAGKEQP